MMMPERSGVSLARAVGPPSGRLKNLISEVAMRRGRWEDEQFGSHTGGAQPFAMGVFCSRCCGAGIARARSGVELPGASEERT